MAVLNPMLEAVVAALNGDAQLPALITGVYSGRAPAAAIMDYLVIVDMNAGGLSRFAAGQIDRGEFSIRIWTRDFSSAAILYDHVKRILHRQKIVVAGAANIAGKVELVATIPDPGDTQSIQSVVNYAWITHVNA